MTRPITTFELWRMPEWIAFCKAVGIEYYLPIPGSEDKPGNGMILEIPFNLNGLVLVTQTYICRPGFRDETKAAVEAREREKDSQLPPILIETTTPHNQHTRTYTQSKTE